MSQKLIDSFVQFLDGNGNPLAGGSLVFSETGTDTPKTVYAAENETTSLGSEVTLDASGRPSSGGAAVDIYSAATGAYRMRVRDSSDVVQVTTENLSALSEFSSLTMTGQLAADDSTSTAAPPYSFVGDLDTGVARPAADVLAFVTGGTEGARIDSSGRMGIGNTTPSLALDVKSDSTQTVAEFESADLSAAFISLRDATTGSGTQVGVGASGNELLFRAGNAERGRFDDSGNLLIGGTGGPASATNAFALFNGTAPTGSVANGVILYSDDVATAELRVRDEAGNVTTLSPHNFDLIPGGASEAMAWSYYSERDGKRINADILRALRVLEKLSGEQLVFEE